MTRAMSYESETLLRKLKVQNIYIDEFLENPFFKPTNTDSFLKALVTKLSQEFADYAAVAKGISEPTMGLSKEDMVRNVQNLWSACNTVLKISSDLIVTAISNISNILDCFAPFVDNRIKMAALEVLERVVSDKAGVQEILRLKKMPQLLCLLDTVPPIQKVILDCLNEMVSRRDETVAQIRTSGGVLYLLKLIIRKDTDALVREKAAELLCKLTMNTSVGTEMAEYIMSFLSTKFADKFQAKPAKFIEFVDADHKTEDREWNSATRSDLQELLSKNTHELSEQAFHGNWDGFERFHRKQLSVVFPDFVLPDPSS